MSPLGTLKIQTGFNTEFGDKLVTLKSIQNLTEEQAFIEFRDAKERNTELKLHAMWTTTRIKFF